MALIDSVNELMGSGPAKENRVKLLLKRLEGTEDQDTLVRLLRDASVTSAFITRVLRKEYGDDVVTNLSVASYRRDHLPREVSGL